MRLNAYLYFDGQCEDAFKRYESVLGGKIVFQMRYDEAPSDQPDAPGGPSRESLRGRIMHARLQVGDQILMGSDTPVGAYRTPQSFAVAINLDKPEDAERIHAALSEGGSVHMPLMETFFSHRFGMLQDRFGTHWLINCEKSEQPAAGAGTFTISRTLDAPLGAVWNALTDGARMQQWWGPKGAEIISSKMDLRPGGTYHYGMRMPDGKVMWGRMVYREIEPQKRIHLVSGFSDESGGLTRHPLAPVWPLELLSTFTFEEKDGKTVLSVRWEPLNPTPDEKAAFDKGHISMTNGWTGTLDKLEAYLARARAV